MVQRIARLLYRLLDRMRHRDAFAAAGRPAAATGFDSLMGHHHCLLVTFRRTGEPVPTPVLFGLEDGKLYFRTDSHTAKVARIRNNPDVLVGAANSRGKPLGPLARGTARLLPAQATDAAYDVLKHNYSPVDRVGERMLDLLPIEMTYVEVSPT
jgi:PPOX class probable F420-dependent enzyme